MLNTQKQIQTTRSEINSRPNTLIRPSDLRRLFGMTAMVQAYLQVACCELNHLFIPTGVKLRQNSCILVLKCGDIFIACHLFLVCFFAYPYLSKLVVFRVYDTLTCYGAYDWCSFIGLLVASQQKMKLHKKFTLRT